MFKTNFLSATKFGGSQNKFRGPLSPNAPRGYGSGVKPSRGDSTGLHAHLPCPGWIYRTKVCNWNFQNRVCHFWI